MPMMLARPPSVTGKRVAGVDHRGQDLVVGRVDVEHVHAGLGHHHVAGHQIGHAQHALEHGPRLGLDQLAVLGLGQRLDQFVLGVGTGRDELDHPIQQGAAIAAMGHSGAVTRWEPPRGGRLG
jgi:hypothetical protein